MTRRAAALGLALAVLSWADAPAPGYGAPAGGKQAAAKKATTKAKSDSHLYVLLGYENRSPGLPEFGADMQKKGIPTTVGSYADWHKYAAEMTQLYVAGKVKTIMIVGHSLGAGAARAIAIQLNERSIPIALMVTLGSVGEERLTPNVRRGINIDPKGEEDHFTVITSHIRELSDYVLGTTRSAGVPQSR